MTKTKILNAIFIVISFAVFNIHFFTTIEYGKSVLVYFTFYLIGLTSLLVLCFHNNFISVIKIAFAFIFIFFFYAPLGQYSTSTYLWGHTIFVDDNYLQANLLILLSMLLIFVFYSIFSKTNKFKVSKYKYRKKYFINKKKATILSVICLIVFLYEFFTGKIFGKVSSTENADGIISALSKTIRFIPVSSLLILLFDTKYNNTFKVLKPFIIFNSIIVIILYFPFAGSISRFMLFGAYMMIVTVFIKQWKLKALLPLGLIIGFGYMFPAFNFFKTHSIDQISQFSFFTANSYNTVDFDAYQMIMESIKYVNANGYTYGGNILSAVLFFVPRSIWSGKYIPSGEIIAEYYGATFTNLSCPYIAEFILAFGVPGVIFGSIIVGLLLGKFEIWFNSDNSFKKGIATIILGVLIYWLRGAMLPTTSYLMAFILSYFVVICFVSTNKQYEKNEKVFRKIGYEENRI